MNKKICVYTCITGDYDNVIEITKKEKNIDYYLFTNNKNIKSNTWDVIYIEDDKLDNQRLSRKIKMLGHPIIDERYSVSIWMDACIDFQKSINEFVNMYYNEKEAPFSAFKHHLNNCIYQEANDCIRMGKDTKENVVEHIKFLKEEKYPKDNGLYEMTVFIKNHNDPKVKETMKLWFDMVCNHSKRDQLSFMYSVWKTHMRIKTIDLVVWDNEWFLVEKHNYKTKIDDYKIYFDNGEEYNYNNNIFSKFKKSGNLYEIVEKVPTDTLSVEIQISSVPCIKYKNLIVDKVQEKEISVKNMTIYKNRNIFYNEEQIIVINHCFKKGDTFRLKIEIEKMTETEIYDYIDYLNRYINAKHNHIKSIDKMNELLYSQNVELNNKIRNIEKSRSWRMIDKIRMIKSRFKHKDK